MATFILCSGNKVHTNVTLKTNQESTVMFSGYCGRENVFTILLIVYIYLLEDKTATVKTHEMILSPLFCQHRCRETVPVSSQAMFCHVLSCISDQTGTLTCVRLNMIFDI